MLEKQPEIWGEITDRQTTPGSPHSDTKSIFLRWCASKDIPAVFTEIPAIDYPAMDKLMEVWPLLHEIENLVGSKQLGRVMIVKLEAGGMIDAHVDEGAYADHYERFHLPLQSNKDNCFFVESDDGTGGEFATMLPGELWWFNHKKRHWASNLGDQPRIHLIIDAVAPKYRRERT